MKCWTRTVLSVALLVSAAIVSSPVGAQQQVASDADRAAARELGREGLEALDAKDYETAVDRLSRAIALYDAPTLRLGRARALRGQGRLVSAAEDYRTIKFYTPQAGDPPAIAEAKQAAELELAEVEPMLARLTIFVPEGATWRVSVDGVEWPAAALGVARPIDPGAHVIESQAPDGQKQTQQVRLAAGANDVVTLEPPSTATPASPPPEKPSRAPSVAATRSVEPTPRKRSVAFELGGSLGLAFPLGDQTEGFKLGDSAKIALPFGLHIGVRFIEQISVSLYGSYGPGVVGDLDQEYCDLYQYDCTVSVVQGGLQVAYRFQLDKPVTPWLGLGLGGEALISTAAYPGAGEGTAVLSAAPQVLLVGGVDFQAIPKLEWGPFASASFATYGRLNTEATGVEDTSTAVPDAEQAGHTWFTLGVRGVFVL